MAKPIPTVKKHEWEIVVPPEVFAFGEANKRWLLGLRGLVPGEPTADEIIDSYARELAEKRPA